MGEQVDLEAVRPDGGTGAEEHRLEVGLSPLRLRLDQNVLDFLATFAVPPMGLSFDESDFITDADFQGEEPEWGSSLPPSLEPESALSP